MRNEITKFLKFSTPFDRSSDIIDNDFSYAWAVASEKPDQNVYHLWDLRAGFFPFNGAGVELALFSGLSRKLFNVTLFECINAFQSPRIT